MTMPKKQCSCLEEIIIDLAQTSKNQQSPLIEENK